MLLACGAEGLLVHQGEWRTLPCPLPWPEMLAWENGRLAVLDNTSHAVWTGGRVLAVDSGVEAMLLWHDALLILSGDTDCLTMISLATGQPMLTIPAGVYPQDMCLLPGGRSLAVCGGADGTLRIIRLPDLWAEQVISLPGSVQRAACMEGVLYALCALEEDGLCCQLCCVQGRSWRSLARWPGLPGAIHGDETGKLWVAASEVLGCFQGGEYRAVQGSFGLIRHMTSRRGVLLASDPVMDALWQAQGGRAEMVYEGGVQHGIYA